MTELESDIVTVLVDDVIFRSEDGRFAVVRAQRVGRDGEMTIVGDLGAVSTGETLRVRGKLTSHRKYGKRFTVESFTPVMPKSKQGIAKYLGSGLVPGIGKSLAERLVIRFGERTLDVIATESSRLREVDGIGAKRAGSIAEAVRSRRAEAETMSYLHSLGLGPGMSRRLLRKYGNAAVSVVRQDPYRVAEDVPGIGFRTADRIGQASGINRDDPRRAAGALLHLLRRGAEDGHVFLPRQVLQRGSEELSIPTDRIEPALAALEAADLVVLEGDAVYRPALHRAELTVAQRLRALAAGRVRGDAAKRARALQEATDGGELTQRQREAVDASLAHRLVVLTGGPGTGKTTTVRAIVEAHRALGHRVELCAPTGRAAKRLSEATSASARTIHRLLEWSPMDAGFRRDAETPVDAELVLVDEASMLDIRLASSLLSAVADGTSLVLVGDIDQLPPVGPGQPLRELIASNICTVVTLDTVFRQAQKSAIVVGAHEVRAGRAPKATPPNTKGSGDLFYVKSRDVETIPQRLISTLDRIHKAYGLDPTADVQVLTPMRRGPAGTARLNEALSTALNDRRRGASSTTGGFVVGDGFVPGDKVMQLRNDYDKDVFNGDLGEVHRVEGGITFVHVDGREIQYEAKDLDALGLAYASTIHKVQGSEFPAVVVVLHSSHYVLLSRALLYTAITRAKRLVVLLGDPRAIARAARNASSYDSHTKLEERLRAGVV